jgi:hypothetical protein
VADDLVESKRWAVSGVFIEAGLVHRHGKRVSYIDHIVQVLYFRRPRPGFPAIGIARLILKKGASVLMSWYLYNNFYYSTI